MSAAPAGGAKKLAGAANGNSKRQMRKKQQQQLQPQRRPVINAMLRGQVELKCNLQPPDADDEVSLILWYKDNSMVPIYR